MAQQVSSNLGFGLFIALWFLLSRSGFWFFADAVATQFYFMEVVSVGVVLVLVGFCFVLSFWCSIMVAALAAIVFWFWFRGCAAHLWFFLLLVVYLVFEVYW